MTSPGAFQADIPPAFGAFGRAMSLGFLLLLGACATSASPPAAPRIVQGYPAPGPESDPWGPYIEAAAARFDVSPALIRAVIERESRGEVHAVSREGARGLMQLMPRTYEAMRAKYGLGGDPFNPRDNILAGAAYLHDLAARVGSAHVLAAYNAGPEAWLAHERHGRPLPAETVAYVRALSPQAAEKGTSPPRHTTTRHAVSPTHRAAIHRRGVKKTKTSPSSVDLAEH